MLIVIRAMTVIGHEVMINCQTKTFQVTMLYCDETNCEEKMSNFWYFIKQYDKMNKNLEDRGRVKSVVSVN